MASLFWTSSRRQTGLVGQVKLVISGKLRDHGFTGVEISDLDVKASKGDTFTSVAHFKISDQLFWEVAMTSGGPGSAKTVNDEVARILRDEIHIVD
jgi:hypothetical protein